MSGGAAASRRNLRRPITYPASIDLGDGSPALDCVLCDVADEGARIEVAEPHRVPNEFILALSSGGAAWRSCRVAWRRGGQIGVLFLKETRRSMRPAVQTLVQSDAPPLAVAEPQPAVEAIDIDTLDQR